MPLFPEQLAQPESSEFPSSACALSGLAVGVLLAELVLQTRKAPHCEKLCGFCQLQQKFAGCRFTKPHRLAGLMHAKIPFTTTLIHHFRNSHFGHARGHSGFGSERRPTRFFLAHEPGMRPASHSPHGLAFHPVRRPHDVVYPLAQRFG